jgi:GT2 family glycosyltransferase
MNVDHPAAHSSVFSGSILLVRGWATARDGIEKVEIQIDDGELRPATYGLLREDVESIYPDFVDASRTGFIAAFGSGNLGTGEHWVHVIATSKSGACEDKSVSFSVDRRTEYEIWAGIQQPTRDHLLMLLDEQLRLGYRPLISIITPVYRTPREFLKRCVGSVLKQAYPNWELILIDDCSDDPALSELLRSFEAQDRRIRVIGLAENQGIAGASNVGLKTCRGSYVGLLDHDDELAPNALFEICKALNEDRALDVLYSDEDKIDETGKLCDPFFKPDWSPDLLLSMNYICHFLVARTSLLNSMDGFRMGFDGSQDYDLVLRLAEQTNKIHRIPKVLYHWRMHRNSTASGVGVKPGATSAGRRAIQGHLDRRGVNAQAIEIGAGRYRVRYRHPDRPEVGIVVPTGGSSTLRSALESVLEKTSYPNFRITVVDNSKGNSVREVVSKVQAISERVDLVDCRNLPFNFSYLCNYGAAYGRSPYLMFLNDDTSIITPDWLEAMMEHAQRDEVGAVGAQLLFPNDTTQHAGVVMGLMGLASHPFRGLPPELHYFALSQYIRNCAAVTGACLLTRRDVFDAVKGFDEDNLPTCFQDVDICLKMVERGYRVVYTPYARLYHYESYSKKAIANLSELEYMRERWADMIADDPFYNPCLTRTADDYGLNYDRLFSRTESEGSGDAKEVEQAGVIEEGKISHHHTNIRHHGTVEFYALPNPLTTRSGPGQTTLFWDVEGVKKVQIRVNGPGGPLFAEEGPSGKASTGTWVEPNTTFYLLDATKTSTPSPEQVLATVTIRVLAREQPYGQLAAGQHA